MAKSSRSESWIQRAFGGLGFVSADLGMPFEVKRERNVLEAFKKSSFNQEPAQIGFGTGARPSLMTTGGGPGPGAYPIKTTLGPLMESHITAPLQFSLRGREKFGDPNAKSMNKTAANEPGPGAYDLTGKFLGGRDPRPIGFPKGVPMRDKSFLGPGPGSYKPLESMGRQSLSTKPQAVIPGFPKAPRGSLVPVGLSEVGPGEYGCGVAACEPQVESTKPTCATVKIGTGWKKGQTSKKYDFSEPSPGPGSYTLPEPRSKRAAQLSGRTKFGSPW